MSESAPCPDQDQWQALLGGALPEPRQAELTSHLDTCLVCQQTLQGLAAGNSSVPEAVRRLTPVPEMPESALVRAMQDLRGQPRDATTLFDAARPTESVLDFLSP